MRATPVQCRVVTGKVHARGRLAREEEQLVLVRCAPERGFVRKGVRVLWREWRREEGTRWRRVGRWQVVVHRVARFVDAAASWDEREGNRKI